MVVNIANKTIEILSDPEPWDPRDRYLNRNIKTHIATSHPDICIGDTENPNADYCVNNYDLTTRDGIQSFLMSEIAPMSGDKDINTWFRHKVFYKIIGFNELKPSLRMFESKPKDARIYIPIGIIFVLRDELELTARFPTHKAFRMAAYDLIVNDIRYYNKYLRDEVYCVEITGPELNEAAGNLYYKSDIIEWLKEYLTEEELKEARRKIKLT